MATNLSPNYYQQNKERLRKKSRERYQSLPKEEKEKKQQYSREHCKNLSENEKINWLSMEKILQNKKKHFIIIVRKKFNLEKV